MAKPNATVKAGTPPFMPPVFVQHPPVNLGNTNPYTGPREDGPGAFVNYDNVSAIAYNGQNQTTTINQTFKP